MARSLLIKLLPFLALATGLATTYYHTRIAGILLSAILSLLVWQWLRWHQQEHSLANAITQELRERERLLLEARTRLSTLINTLPDMIWLKDVDGVYLACNPRFQLFFGASEPDILGKTDYDFVDRSLADSFRENDRIAISKGGPNTNEEWVTFANDGHQELLETTKTPMFDAHGNLIGVLGIGHNITQRKQVEMALKDSEQRFRDMVHSTDGIVWEADAKTFDFTFVSDQAERLLGFPVEDWLKPGFWVAHLHPDDMNWAPAYCAAYTERLERHDFEYRFIARDGRTVWLRDIVAVMDEDGAPRWLRGIMVDITLRKQTEKDLRISATAFETQEGKIVTDADGVILKVNRSFTNITGYTEEDVIGKTPRILSSGRHDADFYATMWKSIVDTGSWDGEIWNRRKNGEVYPEHLSINAVKDSNDIITNYVGAITDITRHKESEGKIQQLAFYDPLTRLPNRRLLIDRLKLAMASSSRSGLDGALLLIDLDDFKSLNDTLGHDMGDLLLQQVASRLTSCVREGDTVARLGGDEFVVMLEDLSEHPVEAATQAETTGHKILAALNHAYQLASLEYRSTPSIGITLFNDHEQGVEELLKQADIAMYQAKQAGRNSLRFFDPGMQETLNNRVVLENALRQALEKQQFHLYYQIQVDRSHHPVGAEVLIRWLHPERGLVSPAQFIPLAEETGLILPIGEWVLDTACAQIKSWQNDALTRDLVLAVNVSAKQFRQADFVAQVKAATQRHAVNPRLLKLELTESLLLNDIEDTIATMIALKEIGIQFSLDDFGTGYSSLQYLKMLPLDQLKIDQSFVRDIASDNNDKAIVRTIIAMAQSLNLNVIAEGVETEDQRQFLLSHDCTHFQGFMFSKPVPIEQFEALLKQA